MRVVAILVGVVFGLLACGEPEATPAPARLVVEELVDFGVVDLGATVSRTLVLRNAGAAPLRVEGVSLGGSEGFEVDWVPVLLEGGAAQGAVLVQLAVRTLEPQEGVLRIRWSGRESTVRLRADVRVPSGCVPNEPSRFGLFCRPGGGAILVVGQAQEACGDGLVEARVEERACDAHCPGVEGCGEDACRMIVSVELDAATVTEPVIAGAALAVASIEREGGHVRFHRFDLDGSPRGDAVELSEIPGGQIDLAPRGEAWWLLFEDRQELWALPLDVEGRAAGAAIQLTHHVERVGHSLPRLRYAAERVGASTLIVLSRADRPLQLARVDDEATEPPLWSDLEGPAERGSLHVFPTSGGGFGAWTQNEQELWVSTFHFDGGVEATWSSPWTWTRPVGVLGDDEGLWLARFDEGWGGGAPVALEQVDLERGTSELRLTGLAGSASEIHLGRRSGGFVVGLLRRGATFLNPGLPPSELMHFDVEQGRVSSRLISPAPLSLDLATRRDPTTGAPVAVDMAWTHERGFAVGLDCFAEPP